MNASRIPELIYVFYNFVMPAATTITFLVVSQFIRRPFVFGSGLLDFLARVLLCLWFFFSYTRLLNIKEKYKPFSDITWSKSDIDPVERILLIGLAIFFGTMVTLFTWMSLNAFVPIVGKFGIVLAIANGVVFLIPLCLQYEVFKI
jgi:hypothetical protein